MNAVLMRPTRNHGIQDALETSPQPELRRLLVTVSDDTVIILGHVSSFFMKQMAQETVKAAASGRKLVNRVSVEA